VKSFGKYDIIVVVQKSAKQVHLAVVPSEEKQLVEGQALKGRNLALQVRVFQFDRCLGGPSTLMVI